MNVYALEMYYPNSTPMFEVKLFKEKQTLLLYLREELETEEVLDEDEIDNMINEISWKGITNFDEQEYEIKIKNII